jgi:hypothetical protein
MNTQKLLIAVGIVALAVLVTLALFTQLTQAQGPGGNVQPQSPSGVAASLSDSIPIQGRLTDASGSPLNGTYTMNFRVYTSTTGGSSLCENLFKPVSVANGLFNSSVDFCAELDAIEGDQLYLGVQVGADSEMTPRQPILGVPYAYTVRPGAVIKGANSYVFVPGTAFIKDQSTDATRWDAIDATTRFYSGEAIVGYKHIRIPITLPSVLYGQPVRVTGITVYYMCEDGTQNYISETELYKQLDADTSVSLIDDTTNHTSNTASSYTLTTDSANNTLSIGQGIVSLRIGMFFNDNTHYVRISGVRVILDHTH